MMCEIQRKTVDRKIRTSSKHLKALNLTAGVFSRSRLRSDGHRTLHALLCCEGGDKRQSRFFRLHKSTSSLIDDGQKHIEKTVEILRKSATNITQNSFAEKQQVDNFKTTEELNNTLRKWNHEALMSKIEENRKFQFVEAPIFDSNHENRNAIIKDEHSIVIKKKIPSSNLNQKSRNIDHVTRADILSHKANYKGNDNITLPDVISSSNNKKPANDNKADISIRCDEKNYKKYQVNLQPEKQKRRHPHKPCRKFGVSTQFQPTSKELNQPTKSLHRSHGASKIPTSETRHSHQEFEKVLTSHYKLDKSHVKTKNKNQILERRYDTFKNERYKNTKNCDELQFRNLPIHLSVTYCHQGNYCNNTYLPPETQAKKNVKLFHSSKSIQAFPNYHNKTTIMSESNDRLTHAMRVNLRSLRDYTIAELLWLEVQSINPGIVRHPTAYYSDCCDLLRCYKNQRRRLKLCRQNSDLEKTLLELEKETKWLQTDTIKIQKRLANLLERKTIEKNTIIRPSVVVETTNNSYGVNDTNKDEEHLHPVPALDLSDLNEDAQYFDKNSAENDKADKVTPRVPPDSDNTSDGISSIQELVNDSKLVRWDNQMLMRLPYEENDEPQLVSKPTVMAIPKPIVIVSQRPSAMDKFAVVDSNLQIPKFWDKNTIMESTRIESGRSSTVIASDESSTVVGSARSTVRSAEMSVDSLEQTHFQNQIPEATDGQVAQQSKVTVQNSSDNFTADSHSSYYDNFYQPQSTADDLLASLDLQEDLGKIKIDDDLNDTFQIEADEDFWFDKFSFDEKKHGNKLDPANNSPAASDNTLNKSSYSKLQMKDISSRSPIETDRSKYKEMKTLNHPKNAYKKTQEEKAETIANQNGSDKIEETNLTATPKKKSLTMEFELDRSVGDELIFSELDSADDLQLLSDVADHITVDQNKMDHNISSRSANKNSLDLNEIQFNKVEKDQSLEVSSNKNNKISAEMKKTDFESEDEKDNDQEPIEKVTNMKAVEKGTDIRNAKSESIKNIPETKDIFGIGHESRLHSESGLKAVSRFEGSPKTVECNVKTLFNNEIDTLAHVAHTVNKAESDESGTIFEEESLSEILASDIFDDSDGNNPKTIAMRKSNRLIKNLFTPKSEESKETDSSSDVKESTPKSNSTVGDSETGTSIHEDVPDNVNSRSDELSELS